MISWGQVSLDLPDDRGVPFWEQALGWSLGTLWDGLPRFASFNPPDGDSYVFRQLVDGPPRVHLDLETDDPAADQERLIDLGASLIRVTADWRTLRSPGGAEFCLVQARDRRRPAPRGEPGRRSRLVQLSLDAPAADAEREFAFWRAATAWRFEVSDSPEFAGTLYPAAGSSIELLLQRLSADSGATSVGFHIDLGCDDREAEAERLVGLGAERLYAGDGWITLRDPAGMIFCATGRSPDAP